MKIFSLMDRRNNVRILTVLGVMLMSSVRLMADSFTIDGINYSTTSDTEVEVTGGSVTGALDIPSEVTYGEKQYDVTSIGSQAFQGKYNKSSAITSVHIPGSVRTIGIYAFYDNYYMESIVIDEGVDRIENEAFGYNGNSLGANSCSLSLPNSITYIGTQAFQNNGCFNITILDLPESLSFIGQSAFRNCSSALEEIVIHGNVTEIQSNSFGELSNLKSVWVLSSSIPSTTNGNPFNDSQQNATLHVPSSLLESYQSADYWKDFAKLENCNNHPEYMKPIVVFDRTTWQIGISCLNPDATIYFTTDDTTPTISSDTYTSPFFYDGNITVVKAIAVCEGFDNSEVVSLNLDTSSLFLTPQPVVTMSSDFKVTMECALPGATIYYHYGEFESWRDENYRISNSTLYEGPFTLPYATKLSVEAIANGYAPSGWTAVDYHTNYYVESPVISSEQVIDETYRTVKSRTVSIDYHPTNTYGGTGAYYTIDGSDPNTSSTQVEYTGPFTVDRNCTVRAVAYKDGRINSKITELPIDDVDSQFKVDGIYYNKAENTIGDYVEVTVGGLPYTGDIVIPETVTDAAGTTYKVIRIGCNAFAHNYGHDITSISLPATIESIGEYAFYDCDNLKSITLPSGVKSIERYAFNDCNNLEDISLGESLVSIGECAFYNCRNLTSLSLPATLREIKSQAFNCCDGLTTIELPNAIHTIGYFAFGNCNNLSTITMPNSLTSIGEYAFTNCDKLTSIAIPEGVTVIPSHCFQYCRSLASVTLPSTLQEIKDYAFRECDALTTVDLPRTLTSMGNNVFESCDKLTSIAIPEGVTVILSSAFWYCRSLTSVKLPSTVKEIQYGAFYFCENLTTINLPSNVQSIGGQAFANCSNLTSINLPASLTSLEYNVFEQCSKLTSIVIPEGITVIPSYAFYNCSSLASVTLPSTLKTINSSAFQNCSSLNSIILPASLTEIYDNAFNGCSALTAVYSYASNPPVLLNQPHAFTGVLTNANLYVNSEEAVNIYMGAHIWQDFLSVGTVGVLPCAFQLNNCSLSISSQTEGASIYYTRDGSEPTASSTLYEGPIDFLVSDTIRAIAVKEGLGNSPVAVFQQELKVESPVVSINKDLVITITPAEKPSEKLADVRYYYSCSENRWNWPELYSKPEEVIANCTLYTEPLHPEKPGRMRVYALRDGWTMSATEFNYFDGYYLDSPNINWNSETHVFSITHNTSGVVIYYTLDGSDPRTSETRIKYDAPFAVDRNTTLRAVAIKDGVFDTQVAEQSVSNVGKQFKVDDIHYTLAENSIGNCVEVTTGGLPYTGDIFIPETVTDADEITYTVVRIGRNAFNHSNGHDIKSISLPATIESIGEYAFNDCDNITSITLPSGVKSIEQYAFYNCNNLEEINLGESLVSIGEYAFAFCSKLTRLSLPATLQEIKSCAFNWDGLTTIELPDAIHTIGSSAFGNCNYLSTITMPSSLTSLGESAFSNCGKLTSIAIPEGVTVIPSNCFDYCRSLASVTLPSTLQEIKNYAFHECDALTTIDLPDALTSMGNNVFESCDKLTSIAIPEGVTVIPSSAFWNCRSLTSVKLPSNVQSIGGQAFSNCSDLTSINLPSNVQSIGGQAFYLCSNLTSINLPASLTSLEYNVFEQCSKLTSIAIPEGVTDIPSSAFYGCSSLTSIILPASLEKIYENAFSGCSSLTLVYSYASTPPAVLNQPHAFTGVLTNANLYVSPEAVNTYKGATIWQDFLSVGTIGVLPCAFQFKDYALSINCQTEGASIYYTRDGSEPTASSTLYEGPIDFLVSDTIRAIAVKEGVGNSPVAVFQQELKVESPVVSIDKDLVITITPAEKPSEKLADVRYYYNYSEDRWNWPELYSKPEDVIANCTLYTGPVHPLQSGRMRVYALRDGWMMSETDFDYSSDAYYTDSPNINASYNGSNYEVTISHNTEGVVIYYTLDGTDPNTSDSRKVYTEPIILATNTRILAVATLKDHFNSSVSEYSNGRWYSFEQNGIYYRITGDTEVTVSGGSATGALDIPEKVSYGEKQYAVTSIMNDAFSYNNNITSVHIPGSVKTIGSQAFYDNYYMSSIVIDEGVERIASNAFGYNGNSLGANSCSLSLPNSITYIDSYAFQNNGHLNITTLDLPDSLTYIGYEAFRQCSSNVTEIVIKGKVESIGNNAFGYLNNLKSVYVLTPQIPKTDEGDPFNGGQSKVTLYASPSLLESYKTADYWKSFGGYESYTNPVIRFNTDIWQISMACYNPGSKIYYTTDGTEPSDSSSLYTAPFKYDGNISVIKAVSVCNGKNSDVITLTLDKSYVPTPKPTVSLSSDFKVTMECPMPGAKIYYQYNDYSWQDENTRIAESTLYDGPFTLTYGTHIYVEAIADGFAGSGWSDINYYSGYYVSQPDILFEKAADSKSGKVTIDYHPDWSDGGTEAYYTIDGSDPSTSPTRIKYDTPFNVDRNCTVRAVAYKEGRLYSQIREEECSKIDSKFEVDGIYYNLAENTIGNAVEVTYDELQYIGDIVIPETVTKEDGTKFTVVRIGNQAFDRNLRSHNITSISLPTTIQSIGEYAFRSCDKLISIVLPEGVKSIGREAFGNCYNLEDISLGTSLEYLGENAFDNCSKLLSIKLPATLKSLESSIFQNCSKLTSIAIPESVTVIPSSLFLGCSNLTSVSLPSTLKTIEYDAFNNCSKLTSIILPASLAAIEQNAFNGCSSMKTVYSLANVPPTLRNEPHAFNSILTIATLYVNSDAVNMYKGTTIWQSFKDLVTKEQRIYAIDSIPCTQPTFSCENLIMTISCSTPGAVIYYTVDGTDPSKSATRIQYTGPFEFALNGTPLYAVATKDGMKDSDKSVYSRNLVVSDPVIYRNGKQLTITNQTPNAKIYYVVRKDRFEPTWSHYSDGSFGSYDYNTMFGEFHLYEGVTSIPYAGTIYAIAKREGWGDSQCMYLDTGDGMNLNPPTISCDDKTRTVTITHNNDDVKDAKCYYTLNGEDPNYSSAIQLYEKPFTIDRNYTIQAIVTEEEKYFNSSIAKKAIDWFQTTKPEIKITVLPDDNKVMAEIVCQGENDSIFYSTSASVDKKSPVYKEPFELTSISATITTISAIAVRNGWKDSEKASFTFRKPDYTCKTPTFTENKKDSTLSISSSEGASIYYTVDGKTPSKQSAKYTAPIKIEHNQTIRAIAYHTNLLTSQEGEYDISWVEMNSPRIVINGNMCTITSDKPGATIRYALSDDHLRDTQIDYQVYSGPFQLSKKQTDIGAYATLTNYNDSKVAWKTFTPGEDASCQKPQIIRDGETDYVIMSSGTDDAVIYYTLNGLTPNTKSDKYTGPIPVSSNVTVKAMSTADGYFDSDITTFNVDWFTLPVPEISIDGNCAIISCLSTEATIYYTLDGKNPTTKSAVYTEPVLLTGNVEIRAMAVLKGWNNSDVAVFTPNSFVCDEVQFDYDGFYLILSTDDGSTIHYTTDGSEPTEEGLTYTEPIVISDFITVKAMSSKPFYADSPVSSYEITFISDGEDATINCEAGQLQKIINQTGSSDGLTALTIKGSINQADLAFIRTVESLEHLDLTETTVDEFGFQDNAFEGMNLISFSSPKGHVKVGEHIFQDCDGLAAIVWNMDESVPENLLEDTDNPNMMLYVNAITYRPKSYNGNLISGGQATEIVLVDSETGGNFYCPQRFYAKKISFTRSFEQMTEIGITQGWETIALPFDVKTITHETKGALAPFAKGLDKDEYKPFWLCELTSTGFIDASEIKAYTPYLICMPNNSNYADDYILSGKVTFSSEEIYIDENQDNASIKGSVNFTTSLQRRAADPSVMNINLEEIIDESGDYHRTGSAFISGLRETRPFEASAVINVSLSSLRVDNISNGFVTDILKTYSDDLLLKSGIGIYDTDGRKLDVDDLNSLRLQIDTEKIYIVNGQKVLVTPLR